MFSLETQHKFATSWPVELTLMFVMMKTGLHFITHHGYVDTSNFACLVLLQHRIRHGVVKEYLGIDR